MRASTISGCGILLIDRSITVVTCAGTIDWMLDRCERAVVGRRLAEVLGRCWVPSAPAEVLDATQAALEGFEEDVLSRLACRTVLVRSDTGEDETVDWRFDRATLADGSAGACVSCRNVSDPADDPAARALDNERRRIAMRAAQIGIHDFDVLGNAIHWDARTRELWGADPHEPITYETFARGVHPDDLPRVARIVDAALEPGAADPASGEGRFRCTYRVVHRHTRQVRVVHATGLVRFDAGRAVHVIGTVEDVTSLSVAARELIDLAHEAPGNARKLADDARALTQDAQKLRDDADDADELTNDAAT